MRVQPAQSVQPRHARYRSPGLGVTISLGVLLGILLVAATIPPSLDHRSPVRAAGDATYSSIPRASWRVNGTGARSSRSATRLRRRLVHTGDQPRRHRDRSRAQPRRLRCDDRRRSSHRSAPTRTGRLRHPDRRQRRCSSPAHFTTVGGAARARVAAIDPATGAVRTGFRADTNGTVYNLSAGRRHALRRRPFTTIGGSPHPGGRRLADSPARSTRRSTPWSTAPCSPWPPQPDGSKVYIGGPYSNVNGVADTDITTLDGDHRRDRRARAHRRHRLRRRPRGHPDGRHLVAAHSGVPGVGNRTSPSTTPPPARAAGARLVDGDVQGVHLIGGHRRSPASTTGSNGDGASVSPRTTSPPAPRTRRSGRASTVSWACGPSTATTTALVWPVTSRSSPACGSRASPSSRPAPPTPFVAASGAANVALPRQRHRPGHRLAPARLRRRHLEAGIGEFGYGDGDERTRISYGPSSSSKYITTYFRRTFDVTRPAGGRGDLHARRRRRRRLRQRRRGRPRQHADRTPSSVHPRRSPATATARTSRRYFAIDPALLHAGTNTIAVEVHQTAPNSNDLTFFATLVAYGEHGRLTAASDHLERPSEHQRASTPTP